MIDKEERRRALDHIESLEFTVSNAQRNLRMVQHTYLISLGFTHRRGVFVDDYTYQDRTCHGINNALEYADEYI
ncbi:MAG: hypothetical protein GY941_05040 [Planctomycetes bacterium]|nr:hypothetical protein [Planctomycetota bacterium]